MALDLGAVIRGEPGPVRQFVREYGPILRSVIRRILSGDQRQREDDIMQELLLGLFRDDSRVLRMWRPDGGRSLKTYLCVYARHRVIDQLRRGSHAERERPMEHDGLVHHAGATTQGADGDGPAWFGSLLSRFRGECTEQDWQLLELSYLEDVPVGDIAGRLGLTTEAVYQRRHRLKKRLLALRDQLLAEAEGAPSEGEAQKARKAQSGSA